MKYLLLIWGLLLAGCVSYQQIPEGKNKKIAIVGAISEDISAVYWGVTIFENKVISEDMNWGVSSRVAKTVKSELELLGYTNVTDLSHIEKYSTLLPELMINKGLGGEISDEGAIIAQALKNEGYDLLIDISGGERAFVTAEKSINGKGIFLKVNQPYVYSGLGASVYVLSEEPGMAGGSFGNCPKEYHQYIHNFTKVARLPSDIEFLSVEAIGHYKKEILENFDNGTKATLCYYFGS